MKNKINGIDVSECKFYNGCECDAYRHEYWEPQDNTKDMCKEHDNCYFKQLARLQQELDIKEKMLDKFMIGSGETLEKLQKENEELKARLKTLDDEVLTIEITPDEFERYKKCKQALEEIRVFSENFCEDKCPFYENEYSEVCNEACLLDNIVNPILKKIDGVLNDRD